MYEDGKGVKQDYGQAFLWYQRAAEQGDAEAQICLGRLYEKGYGVKKNINEAIKWYSKAEAQGNERASTIFSTIELPEPYQGELEVRIGEKLTERLTSEEVIEFDSITDAGSAAKWLGTHIPEYRKIVVEERRKMIDDFFR